MKNLLLFIILISFAACGQNTQKAPQASADETPAQTSATQEGYKKAYFASGCFWCSESIYESVLGVVDVVSGYSGGTGENPTYETYERKGHAEAIEVTYDPRIINFSELLEVYFGSQDVTQQNGQGPDLGSGYRSIIFYQNEKEKQLIEKSIEEVQQNYSKPVASEIMPFQRFWKAEDYHQNFEERNPNHPYIQNVSLPRLYRFQNKHPELLKKE